MYKFCNLSTPVRFFFLFRTNMMCVCFIVTTFLKTFCSNIWSSQYRCAEQARQLPLYSETCLYDHLRNRDNL